VSDFSISVKVRNARIRRKVVECGFRNVNDLCRQAGLYPSSISALLNLKVSPVTREGSWRRSAVSLAEALGCTCEDLFSVRQRTLSLRTNELECTISERELLKLRRRIERPLIENPGDQLLEQSDEYTKIAVIRRALDSAGLRPRNRKIIESYFGIGCEQKTLGELASEFSVCWQAIDQVITRTLRRLSRSQSYSRSQHRALLQAYQPDDAMGKAHEARIRSPRTRAALLRTDTRLRSVGAPRCGAEPVLQRL
jgi:hypothetical protein